MAHWKEVTGYEGLYLVSDEGDIYSLPREVSNGRSRYIRPARKLKKGLRGKNGLMYEHVVLCRDGETVAVSVHRIVADAFCKRPVGHDHVNHKDHNTLNNCADNLEWCTQQYNNEYGHNKPVLQISDDGEVIARYKNISYASEMTGISRTAINNCLTGWSRTSGGYVWKYADEERGNDLSHSQESF